MNPLLGLMEGLKAAKALGAEQQAFLKTRTIGPTGKTPQDWIQFFEPIERYDIKVEAAKRTAKWITFIGLGLTALGFVKEYFFAAAPLLIVGAVLWILFSKRDVPNTLRRFLLPWLTVLREEVTGDNIVELKLDLSDLEKSKIVESHAVPTRYASERSRKVTIYKDPWFSCSATLVDQSRLQIDIDDTVRKIDVTKRSASGKTKYKSKKKGKRRVTVSLAVASKRYDVPGSVNMEGKWKIKQGEKRRALACRRDFQLPDTKDRLEEWMEVKDILTLVSEVYRQATPIAKSA